MTTGARTADEALAWLRRERARQIAAGMGVALSDGTYLFGGTWRASDFPSVDEPLPVEAGKP